MDIAILIKGFSKVKARQMQTFLRESESVIPACGALGKGRIRQMSLKLYALLIHHRAIGLQPPLIQSHRSNQSYSVSRSLTQRHMTNSMKLDPFERGRKACTKIHPEENYKWRVRQVKHQLHPPSITGRAKRILVQKTARVSSLVYRR